MEKDKYIEQSKYGYLKLNKEILCDLKEYYAEEYYKETRKRYYEKVETTNDIELPPIPDNEWLQQIYSEILEKIEGYNGNEFKSLIDIGCGHGSFLMCAKSKGWSVTGIEPSDEACSYLAKQNIRGFNGTIKEYIEHCEKIKVGCVTLNNVLEHIENPEAVLQDVYELLEENGILSIKVPNEFNALQEVANGFVKNKNWWVSIPDHVNYFDMKSLCRIVELAGFEIMERTCDFPMELFLLMGENYVDDGKVGQGCHEKRKLLETYMPKSLKDNWYQQMAALGMGRNIIVYARKVSKA